MRLVDSLKDLVATFAFHMLAYYSLDTDDLRVMNNESRFSWNPVDSKKHCEVAPGGVSLSVQKIQAT